MRLDTCVDELWDVFFLKLQKARQTFFFPQNDSKSGKMSTWHYKKFFEFIHTRIWNFMVASSTLKMQNKKMVLASVCPCKIFVCIKIFDRSCLITSYFSNFWYPYKQLSLSFVALLIISQVNISRSVRALINEKK